MPLFKEYDMQKIIIFALGVSCISGSAQTKKLVPRTYNAEATKKLEDKLDKTQSPDKITPAYLKEIEQLIQGGADPNVMLKGKEENENAGLVVILASFPAMKPDIDLAIVEQVIRSALNHGANANAAENPSGSKAFFIAAVQGHLGIVKAFFDHGAVFDPKNEKDRTFMGKVKERLVDRKEWLDVMLRNNPKTEKSIKETEQLLKILTSRQPKKNVSVIKTYNDVATRKLQEMLNGMDSPRETFSKTDVLKQVDALIKEGADPNVSLIQTDETIANFIIKMLVFAPFFNEEADAAQLELVLATALEHGANPNVYNTTNNEPIIFHVALTSPKMLELFLDYGASKDLKNTEGENVVDYVKNHLKKLKDMLNENIKVGIPGMKKEIDNLEKIVNMIESKREVKVQIK